MNLILSTSYVSDLLIAFYIVAKYLTALRRGRIDRPCMRQFITVEINVYIHELFLVGIMIATMFTRV